MSCYAGPHEVTNGLVGYFDAGNTKSYSGSGTTWTDLSGSGNNGTLSNTPTYSSTTNGGIFTFNGTNQYLTVSALTDAFLQGTWTASFWVNFTSVTGGYKVLLSHGSATADHGLYLGVNNTWYHSYYTDDMTGSTVSTNTWYNAVFTANNTSKARAIYVNGVLNTSGTATGSYAGTGSNAGVFKQVINTTYNYFSGSAASCMFYNRVLSAAEISQNFHTNRGRFGI
jgi:Concanavalin A-like lectin/glucanases superfamily